MALVGALAVAGCGGDSESEDMAPQFKQEFSGLLVENQPDGTNGTLQSLECEPFFLDNLTRDYIEEDGPNIEDIEGICNATYSNHYPVTGGEEYFSEVIVPYEVSVGSDFCFTAVSDVFGIQSFGAAELSGAESAGASLGDIDGCFKPPKE